MKLERQTYDTEVIGAMEENACSIEMDAEAFNILSSGIYSDEQRAILRELGTNAYDAHVEAGNEDTPFEVHLPNMLEPNFKIRDFGTGMSKETLETVFPTYFKSTKRNSNAQTGCFGLGCKTPFCYTESYQVISYYNGTKLVYNFYKNTEGKPVFSLMQEVETVEPNGLEILFPANDHFWAFEDRAKAVFKYFKTKPIIKGVYGFELPEMEYWLQTDEYGVHKESSGSNVVMGNVAYPFSVSQLNGLELRKSKAPDAEREIVTLTECEIKLINHGVDLYVPLGTVEFPTSRESLKWTPKTVEAVRAALAKVTVDITKQAEKELKDAKSYYEACKKRQEFEHSIIGKVSDLKKLAVEWNNQKIKGQIKFADYVNQPTTMTLYSKKKRRRRNAAQDSISKDSLDYVPVHGRWPIFVDDVGRGIHTIIYNYMRQEEDVETVLVIKDITDYVLETTGLDAVVKKISELPKAERKKRIKREYTRLMKYNPDGCSQDKSSYWENTEVDLNEGGVYVLISRNKFSLYEEEEFENPEVMNRLRNLLKVFEIEVEIYGIRPSSKKMVENHNEWVSLSDLIAELLRENKDLAESVPLLSQAINFSSFGKVTPFLGASFEIDSVFGEFLEEIRGYVEIYENREKINAFMSLQQYVPSDKRIELSRSDDIYKLRVPWGIVKKSYPWFSIFEWHVVNERFVEFVSEYVRLVDDEEIPEIERRAHVGLTQHCGYLSVAEDMLVAIQQFAELKGRGFFQQVNLKEVA